MNEPVAGLERDALNVFVAEMDAAIADEVAIAQDRQFLRNRVRTIIAKYHDAVEAAAASPQSAVGEPRRAG